MSQEHFDRLTALDASFLHQEGPTSHMNVGGVTLFEGPPPPFTELLDGLRRSDGLPTPPLDPRTGGPLRVREVLTGLGGSAR